MGRKKKAVLRQLAAARAARWHKKKKNTTPPPSKDLHLEVCESAHSDDEIEILAPPPSRTGPAETEREWDRGGMASREPALNELPPTSQESTEPTAYEKISMSFEAGKETWKRAEKKRGLGGYTGRAESTRRHRRAQARQRAVEDERLRHTKGAEMMRQFVRAGQAAAQGSTVQAAAPMQVSAASRTPIAAGDEPGPPPAQ